MGVPLSRLRRDFPGRGPVDEKLALTHLLFLCRVNAIQALYKEKIEPTSDVVSAQLTSISEVFSKMVSECEKWWGDKELRSLGKKGSSGDPIERITGIIAGVSRAFDDNLLDHLQGKVDLMKKLKDYLPAHGPMSAEFLRHIDNESKAIFRNTQPRALVKDLFKFKELTRKLMSEDLKKSGQSQSTPGKRKIAVFYATDRVWRNGLPRTKAGRLRYGVQYVSIPRGHEIGKVESGGDDSSTNFTIRPKYGPWRKPNKFLDKIKEQCAKDDVASSSEIKEQCAKDDVASSSEIKEQCAKDDVASSSEIKEQCAKDDVASSSEIKEQCAKDDVASSSEIKEQCAKDDVASSSEIKEQCAKDDVASSSAGPQKSGPEVLLYIHGYNTSFESSIKRAAHLKNDLEFGGQVILYSWPTKGKWWAYHRDEKVIQGTAPSLQKFITTILLEKDSFSKVHILAHSMGSRALIEALTKLSGGNDKVFLQRRPVLKNVILVAADEGLSKFEDMLNKMNNGNSVPEPLISVYSSTRDRALYASALFQRCSRLGSTFSFFVKHSMRGRDRMVDVIDATGVFNHNILGHSYHAKAPEVLTDIQNLLRDSYRRAVERPLIQFKHGPGMDKDPGTDEEDEDPGTDEEDEDPGTDEEDEDPGMDEEDEDPGTDEEDEDLAEWVFHAIKQSWWDKYIKKNPKSGVSKILNSASSTRVRDGCEKLNNLREIS